MTEQKQRVRRTDEIWAKVEDALLAKHATDLLRRLHNLGWDSSDTGHALIGMDPFERLEEEDEITARAEQLTGLEASPEEYIEAYKRIEAFLKPRPYAETVKRLESEKLEGL